MASWPWTICYVRASGQQRRLAPPEASRACRRKSQDDLQIVYSISGHFRPCSRWSYLRAPFGRLNAILTPLQATPQRGWPRRGTPTPKLRQNWITALDNHSSTACLFCPEPILFQTLHVVASLAPCYLTPLLLTLSLPRPLCPLAHLPTTNKPSLPPPPQ